MKKLFKCILSLTVVMLFIQLTACGSSKEAASGECGKSVTWTLDKKGNLIIQGTGKMKNYDYNEYAGWDERGLPEIKSITIKDGVTTIGAYAFGASYDTLESVTIADSVESIGKHAFEGCEKLKSIRIPNSVVSIGEAAFCDCPNLKELVIPDSVTSIGELAFAGIGVKKVSIPPALTSIRDYTFEECAALEEVTIPSGVTYIGEEAFSKCTSLKTVKFEHTSDSQLSIGKNAFYSCPSLKEITIPEGTTSIGEYAFSECTGLKELSIPKSVSFIGENAFVFCDSLNMITFMHTSDVQLTIKERAFEPTYGLTIQTTVQIPDTNDIHPAISGYDWEGSDRIVKYNRIK